jgi:hypothetical protein
MKEMSANDDENETLRLHKPAFGYTIQCGEFAQFEI